MFTWLWSGLTLKVCSCVRGLGLISTGHSKSEGKKQSSKEGQSQINNFRACESTKPLLSLHLQI